MIGASVLLVAGLARIQTPSEDPVRVSVELPPGAILREVPTVVRIRLQVDAEFLREHMLQPFRRAIECPVQLEVPWWVSGADWLVRDPEATAPEEPAWRLVLNGALVTATAVEESRAEERRWWTVTIERTVLARAAGERSLAAPVARYAWTPAVATDVFGGAVPSERRDAEARGERIDLTVLDWPAEDRPEPFSGAVGTLAMRAARETDPAADRLVVRLWIEGRGNWEFWPAPVLDAVPGFHLLGQTERRSAGVLEVRAEFVSETPSPRAFPALEYAYLDPGPPPAYRFARSATVPLPDGVKPPSPPLTPPLTPPPSAPSASRAIPWPLLAATGAAAAAILAAGARARARRRASRAPSSAAHSARPALGSATPPVQVPSEIERDPAAAFAAFLADRFQCSTSSLHDPDLASRLEAQGCPRELAAQVAALFDRLQALRYGGESWSGAAAAVRAAMEELLQAPRSER